jgi:DNA helicase-2/ATP-dependent DNA helicase PcrA
MITKEQLEVVNAKEQHTVVIASAGSGKSFTVVERTAKLVKEGVNPEKIFLTSFSRTANSELQEKIIDKIGTVHGERIRIQTIHAFCFWILRQNLSLAGYKKVDIVPHTYYIQVLLNKAKDLGYEDFSKKDASRIFSKVTQGKSFDNLREVLDNSEYFLFKEVEKIMKDECKITFDDVLFITYNLFKNYEEVYNRYNGMFDYVIIDEAQDTSFIQFEIIKFIVGEKN